MSYRILELEVTEPIPDIVLTTEQEGIAFVLRRFDRPVAFLMRRCPPGTSLESGTIEQWIDESAGNDILSDALREELRTNSPGEPAPSLSVVVCTRDHPELLKRCLGSLAICQSYPGVEVLVVDNAPSGTETQEIVAATPGVRYVCEPRPGLDFARNCGVANARGDYVAFVDDDAVVDRHWLEGFRRACQDNPGAGAYTGPVLPYELATRAQILFEERGGFRRGFRPIRHHQNSPRSRYYPCDAGVFGAGCNMVLRREALLEIGGFDEALDTGRPLPGGGDLDIFFRILRAGYTLAYEPYLMVRHQHRREYHALRRQMWTWGLGMMAFVAKTFSVDPLMRPRLRQLALNWFAYMFRLTLRSAIGRNDHPWRADLAIAETLGGIVGLCGEYGRSTARVQTIRRQFS